MEGFSSVKADILSDLCKNQNINILVLQETHRGPQHIRPKIDGMSLVIEHPHEKYGSAIFINPNIAVISSYLTCNNDIEILTVELAKCTITSVYKPPNEQFAFHEPYNFSNKNLQIILGDFNCRSTSWGYNNTDENGEILETWAENKSLKLLHDPKLPSSFNSRRWKQGYNPDLIFISN